MSITNVRKRQLKWEAVDSAFNRMEYWEDLTGEDITDEERMYLRRAISSMAKHVGITDHNQHQLIMTNNAPYSCQTYKDLLTLLLTLTPEQLDCTPTI